MQKEVWGSPVDRGIMMQAPRSRKEGTSRIFFKCKKAFERF